jgi:hypothetical protein
MLTTTAAYLAVANNLTAQQNTTAQSPQVKNATAYYLANIGKVTSVSQLVNNYQLMSYVTKAYGLEDMSYAKGLITQVIQGGTTSSSALANTLDDSRYKALANAFSYLNDATSTTTPPTSATTTTVNNYVEQTLEDNQGQSNQGVQLALYFQRNASSVTDVYGLLADSSMLKVVQTAFGLPDSASADIDSEAQTLSKYVSMADLQNPTKVQQIAERFTAMWDLDGDNTSTTTTGVAQLFAASSTTSGFSADLMLSMQSLQVGGA